MTILSTQTGVTVAPPAVVQLWPAGVADNATGIRVQNQSKYNITILIGPTDDPDQPPTPLLLPATSEEQGS